MPRAVRIPSPPPRSAFLSAIEASRIFSSSSASSRFTRGHHTAADGSGGVFSSTDWARPSSAATNVSSTFPSSSIVEVHTPGRSSWGSTIGRGSFSFSGEEDSEGISYFVRSLLFPALYLCPTSGTAICSPGRGSYRRKGVYPTTLMIVRPLNLRRWTCRFSLALRSHRWTVERGTPYCLASSRVDAQYCPGRRMMWRPRTLNFVGRSTVRLDSQR